MEQKPDTMKQLASSEQLNQYRAQSQLCGFRASAGMGTQADYN